MSKEHANLNLRDLAKEVATLAADASDAADLLRDHVREIDRALVGALRIYNPGRIVGPVLESHVLDENDLESLPVYADKDGEPRFAVPGAYVEVLTIHVRGDKALALETLSADDFARRTTENSRPVIINDDDVFVQHQWLVDSGLETVSRAIEVMPQLLQDVHLGMRQHIERNRTVAQSAGEIATALSPLSEFADSHGKTRRRV